MDSDVKKPSSVSERVWSVAEKAGADRRARFEKTMNRIFGLPEAVGELAKIGGENIRSKVDEIKQKAIDLKERTEERIVEVGERMVDRIEAVKDNFVSRVETFKKKISDKVAELKKRAIEAGIKTGLDIEERIVKILELPSGLEESRAKRIGEKVVRREKTIEETKAEQFAEMNGLNESQKEALVLFLESQRENKEMLEEEHKKTQEEMGRDIPVWKEKKIKLEIGALARREKIERGRIFKKLINNTK